MTFKDKLNNFIAKKQVEIQRGKEITEQKRAENARKKIKRLQNAKPSAITTMRKGLVSKSSPIDVMKEEWHRRKYERKTR